jgi:hypothetical protein
LAATRSPPEKLGMCPRFSHLADYISQSAHGPLPAQMNDLCADTQRRGNGADNQDEQTSLLDSG